MEVYPSVIAMLEHSGYPFRVHAHPPVTTLEEARRRVPHLTRHLLKTVAFRIKAADWILAAVTGEVRIHYKKLAEALAIKRTDLRSIAPDQVESALGFQLGGVGPFPVRDDIRVVFDQALVSLDLIFCGSGRNTRTIEMRIADLIHLTGGRVHPIIKSP